MSRNDYARNWALSKRKGIQANACAGMIPPKEWRKCEHCGEMYPFFNGAQNVRAKSCPEWLTGKDCHKKLRATKVREMKSGQRNFGRRERQTSIRGSLCAVSPSCIHIAACLDKEVVNPGTMPLKKDGSCKAPNSGVKPTRCRGIVMENPYLTY